MYDFDLVERIREIYDSCDDREKYFLYQILHELAESDDGRSQTYEDIWLADYKEIPVGINTFLDSDLYLGKTNRNGAAVFPFWRKELNTVFGAGNKYYEWVLTGATRIGKTSTANTAMAYMLYRLMCLRDPQKFFGKKDISIFSVLFFNLTEDLAKGVAFREYNDTLKGSPWFNAHGTFSRSERDFYYIPEGGKVKVGYASDSSGALGQQVFCLVGDTKIVTSDGIKSLSELAGSTTKVQQLHDSHIIYTDAIVEQTGEVADTIRIVLEDDTVIEGTPDHRIMLSSGEYKCLRDITCEDDIMEVERWKDIIEYEGLYQISNFGRVRSLDRYVPHRAVNGVLSTYFVKGKYLSVGKGAYPYVCLSKNDIRTNYFIPHLVLQAFCDDYDGIHFYHYNHDVNDNRLCNLMCGYRDLGEGWKPVSGTDNLLWASVNGELYLHSHQYTCGEHTTISVERFVKILIDVYGYEYISVSKFPNLHFVHRIIASTFIQNPDKKDTVNHIDGNKRNNSVSNLEWATMKENINHAFSHNLRSYDAEIEKCRKMSEKNSQKVICVETGEVFPSIKAAAMTYGITPEGLRCSIISDRSVKKLGLRFKRCET